MPQTSYSISAAALHTARVLMRNFSMQPTGNIQATEKNLAIIVDVCTNIFRIERGVNYMVKKIRWQTSDELKGNLDQLREALRVIDILYSRIPLYEGERSGNNMKTLEVPEKTQKKMQEAIYKKTSDPEYMRQYKAYAEKVANARTIEEQQQTLQGGM